MDQTELTMNPEYFIGYLPLTGPIVDPPASAAARQEVIPRRAPDTTASFRKANRIRKQVVPSIRDITDAVPLSQQQGRETMAGQPQTRPQTRAQQRLQQAQALQATRASYQVPAEAARRAALQTATLPAQQQGELSLPSSVRVPKAANATNQKGASGSKVEPNSGGEQKGSTAPTTPPKKATRAVPSSPTSSDSSDGPRFCHCCYTIDSPTWRRSGVQPYDGLTVCNACGMWELHHCKSLTHSGKEGKHWEAFLATQGGVSAEAGETQQPTGAQVAAHQQARSIGHSHETRSRVAAKKAAAAREARAAASAAEAAAAIGGDGADAMQHDTLKAVERQPMQPVRCSADPGLGSQAAEGIRAVHKRKGADSQLQPAAKRAAVQSPDTNDAAIATGEVNECLEEVDLCAAGTGGSAGSGAAQRRRALRLKR